MLRHAPRTHDVAPGSIFPPGEGEWSPSAIKALRTRLRLTQEELAHALGITVSVVNRWENGKHRPSRLAQRELSRLASLFPEHAE